MAIAQSSIDAFLDKILPEAPNTKGMHPDDLRLMIYNCTGYEYEEKTISRPHQLEGLAFALYMRRSFLFFVMRSGKTKVSLDWIAQLQRSRLARKRALVITHAALGNTVWEGQTRQHSWLKSATIHTSGNPEATWQSMIDAVSGDNDVIFLSRHTMQSLFTEIRINNQNQRKLYPVQERIEQFASLFDHAVIDETHFYSDAFGLHTRILQGLVKHCKYRLGLTGTPVGRDRFKIWAQASLIDGGYHFGYNYPFFQTVFGREVKVRYMRVPKIEFDEEKMPIWQYKLDSFSMSYTKQELPQAEVLRGTVRLAMAGEQRQHYNDAMRRLWTAHNDGTEALEASFHHLRMIASGYLRFTDAEGNTRHLDFDTNAKLEWLRMLASELPPNVQCVIFHEYIHSGELICAALEEAKISHRWMYGKTRDKAALVRDFQTGKAQVLVANTLSGGTSIDLPQADYLCYFETTCSPIVRAQSEARPMNRGQRVLMLDDLICAPVEEKIQEFLAEGNDLLRAILSGGQKSLRELFSPIA